MPLVAWIGVMVIAAFVLFVAAELAVSSADVIAKRSRLNYLFLGTILVASATSLPELATNVSAVLVDGPDLAMGDLLGSSMANMAILAIVDLLSRQRLMLSTSPEQARGASVAIGLTSLVAFGIAMERGLVLGWIGLESILLVLLYIAAQRWLSRGEHDRLFPLKTPGAAVAADEGGIGGSVLKFAIAAALILAGGSALAISGAHIAEATGLSSTFVGATLLAVGTSLPELFTSLAAVRLGQMDLAVGNLFGSNALNVAMIIVLDAIYTQGSIIHEAGRDVLVAAIVAMGMMAAALAGIFHGRAARAHRFEPDAAFLLVLYAGGLAAIFLVH